MSILLHLGHGGRTVAFLPPVWTRMPAADRIGVAAVVMAAAFLALVVGTRVWQARLRPLGRGRDRSTEPVDSSWFTADTLDGFPADAVRAVCEEGDAPPSGRLYEAWVLAAHGTARSAVWLERNLDLPPDAARLIVEAAEARRRAPPARDASREAATPPGLGAGHGR